MLKECGDFSMGDKYSEEKKVEINLNDKVVEIYLGTKYFIHTTRTDAKVHFLVSHKLAEKAMVPIIFTRENEENAKAKYPKNSTFYFFNVAVKKPNTYSPRSLDFVTRIVTEINAKPFFVLFDCLDYLFLYNEKKEVLKFAERLFDAISGKHAILIFLICLPLFEPHDLALLERYGEVLSLDEE